MNHVYTPLISIIDLHEWTCRYPIGDPQDWDTFGYCRDSKTDVEKPYCEMHRRRWPACSHVGSASDECPLAYYSPTTSAFVLGRMGLSGRK